MPVDNPFKLAKLKMRAYRTRADRSNNARPYPTWEAMFNPESYSQSYELALSKPQGLNTSARPATYSYSEPSELKLQLLLDGTGVHEQTALAVGKAAIGKLGLPLPAQDVTTQVERFLFLAFEMNGETHEPNHLRVSWGDMTFDCRLRSVDINYTGFRSSGEPLRAQLDVTFVADVGDDIRVAEENRTSPDLTHTRTVVSGDTLPALTRAVYGNAEHYLLVARFNQLDNPRELEPGQELLFPPLDALK